jgi:hypothetical protein
MLHTSRSLTLVLALGLGAGCANRPAATTPAENTTPTSPDANQKDATKNAAGTTSDTGGMNGMKMPTPSENQPTPQSPDIAAKDVSRSPTNPSAPGQGMAAVKGPDFKDATHVLSKDEPYYATSSPAASAKPDGTWAAGTPVLLLIPGSPYSKVKLGNGTEAYVSTSGLSPK